MLCYTWSVFNLTPRAKLQGFRHRILRNISKKHCLSIKNFLKHNYQKYLRTTIMREILQILNWLLVLNVARCQYFLSSNSKEESQKTMQTLVQDLYSKGFYKSKIVEKTMLLVDRKHFCNCLHMLIYKDRPFPITYGSFIAAPSLHATALQLMKRHLKPNARALDVGSGSGYLTAAMATMMGNGIVVGIDHMKALVNIAYRNIRKSNPRLLSIVRFVAADGRRGFAQMAPYDVIHCGAFAESIPDAFKKQLKPGGRLVMALGKLDAAQQLITADLGLDGSWKITNVTHVWTAPLTDPYQQIGKNK